MGGGHGRPPPLLLKVAVAVDVESSRPLAVSFHGRTSLEKQKSKAVDNEWPVAQKQRTNEKGGLAGRP
jgi:hypothetical protein